SRLSSRLLRRTPSVRWSDAPNDRPRRLATGPSSPQSASPPSSTGGKNRWEISISTSPCDSVFAVEGLIAGGEWNACAVTSWAIDGAPSASTSAALRIVRFLQLIASHPSPAPPGKPVPAPDGRASRGDRLPWSRDRTAYSDR